jgi:flagellar basal body-associated protein FliL
MAKEKTAAPPAGMTKNLLILGIVALLASAAGFAAPLLIYPGGTDKNSADTKDSKSREFNYVYVPYGDIVVNPKEDRPNPRYLKVKMTLLVEPTNEKAVTEALDKQKPVLQNWLLTYFADKTIRDLTGAAGINRARREIQDQFNTLLFPDGSEKVRGVLVQEFNFQ